MTTIDTLDASTPQLKAAQKWIDAYLTLDANRIDAVFTRNYKHQTFPKSIGIPEETKDEYLQRLGGLLPLFVKIDPLTIHSVIEVPGEVVLHATDLLPTVYGITLTYETLYTLSFAEEDGELKLSRCQEFIDSQEYGTFIAKIAKAMAGGVPLSEV